jgi:hypothetical protein
VVAFLIGHCYHREDAYAAIIKKEPPLGCAALYRHCLGTNEPAASPHDKPTGEPSLLESGVTGNTRMVLQTAGDQGRVGAE